MQHPTYDIQAIAADCLVKSYTIGNSVIIEAVWTGTLAMPLGSIPIGGQLKANFAQFFEFADGKIIRQRNYDCFEPFIKV
jgi:ketosteroid isomerase-like protein